MGINFEQLHTPFAANEIEWRIGQSGTGKNGIWAKVLAYVTNRAIMDRLDAVCGPANWRNEFYYGPDGAVLCGLSVKIDGEWVTKWDGAHNSDIEAVKGGLSNSMKRAAVQWGIGRYLYKLEEGWAEISEDGEHYVAANTKKDMPSFRWSPPQLPEWALPPVDQHTLALNFIREAYASLADTDTISLGDATVPVKAFLEGEGGQKIATDSEMALTVARAIHALRSSADGGT